MEKLSEHSIYLALDLIIQASQSTRLDRLQISSNPTIIIKKYLHFF